MTNLVPWDLLHLFSLMTTALVKFQPSSYILPNEVKSSWYQFLIPRSQQVPALNSCGVRWGLPQEPPSILPGLPWAIPTLPGSRENQHCPPAPASARPGTASGSHQSSSLYTPVLHLFTWWLLVHSAHALRLKKPKQVF